MQSKTNIFKHQAYLKFLNKKELLVQDALSCISILLRDSFCKAYQLESRILICHALRMSFEELILSQKVLKKEERKVLKNLLLRRVIKEPISYITQKKEFFSLEFFVNKKVLIPRNDTESLIDAVLNNTNHDIVGNILELGVGSGCIIISLLKWLKNSTAVGVDICKKAL